MVIAVGMPPVGATFNLEPQAMAVMAQTMKGSFMGGAVIGRDIPSLVDLWRQGRLKLEELVSGRYRFEQINEAIADARNGTVRRNVIVMDP
jgi:Zn-dependent alcohol dehydrogenase